METCANNTDINTLNYSQIFFMTLGFLPIMLTFPCWVVAKYVFEPMMKDYESKFQEVLDLLHVPTPYHEKYDVKDPSGNAPTDLNNVVLDLTPEGNVAMRYNSNTDAFEYWSDKSVSYKNLETVSRKYVNVFGCGQLYIPRMKRLEEKVEKIKEKIKENLKKQEEDKNETNEDKKEDKKEDSVFASLKNYKNTSNKDIKTKLTKNDIVCDEANKYIRKGKFASHLEWMEPVKQMDDSESTSSFSGGMMSWLEWKNHSKTD